MTPPRSDAWAYEFGAALVLVSYLSVSGYETALKAATFGLFGHGLGFGLGNFLQVPGHVSGIAFSWWKVMEKSMGFIGGAVLAYGLLTADIDELPVVGHIYNGAGLLLVAAIPVLVLVRRLTTERLTRRIEPLPFRETEQTVRV